MPLAYTLIVVEPGHSHRVADGLRRIPYVTEVRELSGPYDVVAKLDAPDITQLGSLVFEQIRALEGIRSTTTLVEALES